MKILFFTENFPPETNAAATRVYERAVYWARWGHDVTIITCQPNFPHGKIFSGYKNGYAVEDMDGMRVVRVWSYIAPNRGVIRRSLDFLSYLVTSYLAARKESRPDVVISTSPQFFAAVAAWRFATARHIPYVFELGDLWPASIAAVGAMRPNVVLRFLEKLELRMYRDAEAVVALTQAFKVNLISRGIDTEKIAVIINGVDTWRYAPQSRDTNLADQINLNVQDFVVGYLGTHGMAHALGNVLDAANILKGEPNIRFLFVGAGAEREALMARAQTEQLHNVIFMPSQPKSDMPKVWSLCDVALVHLKKSPVFAGVIPSKIFEAMGMGLPILFAGPKGQGSDIVDGAHAGIVVLPEDADALANAVRALSTDHEQLKKLAANSAAAAPRYSREMQADHMIRVLQAVIDGNGGQAGTLTPSSSTP